MNRRNPLCAAILFVIVALVGGLAGCSSEPATPAEAAESVSGVAVIVAQKTQMPDWLEVVGTVQASQTSQVASQMTGTIIQINAQEGDRVQSGQTLAVIDDSQPRAAVEQALAAANAAKNEVSAANSGLALAEATLKRYQRLYEKQSVSPQEFDEIRARYQSAEAQRDMAQAGQSEAGAALAQARTSLGYTRIRAPFAGVITQKKADVGMFASPGMPIFTIEDTRYYRLEATVDESDIGIVRLGQAVPVVLDALGHSELSGRVVQIIPAADPVSRSFVVKIELPRHERVRSGLFGRARLPRGERAALLIPQNATAERGQLHGVYVIGPNGIAGLRYITLGETIGQNVEVLSGLQEGERMIADPGTGEFNGKRIVAQP
jgi:RND family efflux transporter MFP subunit